MSEATPHAPASSLRLPRWDDYGQAQRFAFVLSALSGFASLRHALLGELLLAGVCAGTAATLFALCLASDRRATTRLLAVGTPLALTLAALVLLLLTGGRSVAAAAMLAIAPGLATLWGSRRSGWLFLLAAFAIGFVVGFAPADLLPQTQPWIADARAAWLVLPASLALLLLARSWLRAQAAWRQEIAASHAVLAASEARFKAYVENAHDVTAELDARGRVLFITRAKAPHYAVPVAELLGTDGGDYIHPEDLPIARRAFEAAAAGRANVSAPVRYRGAREGWRCLRVAVSSYRTREGKLRFVLQARDETALQEAQAERDRLVAQLEQALLRIETLRGRVAICARCKDVRNEGGGWEPLGEYLASRTLAELSPATCPRCVGAEIS